MRSIQIAEGEVYHIFNRGMHKINIFIDQKDYWRFLFLITHFQSPLTFGNIAYSIKNFIGIRQHSVLTKMKQVEEIAEQRFVELFAFALMPNHFHLIIKEVQAGGIPQYLQRIQNSYTKYFNTKHKTSGHLFQGPYKIVHIADNDQLLHTSAYVHRNCRELQGWKNKEANYPWSSLQDYLTRNRFGKLLTPQSILEQFNNQNEYADFIKNSSAKDSEKFEKN